MQAAQIDRYSKDVDVVFREVPIPVPSDSDVLIRVMTAAVNPVDLLIATGSVRLIQDYPMPLTLGNECSGVVEEVGSAVTGFKKGDCVYARLPIDGIGAFAEYVAINQDAVSMMPHGLGFEAAAAIPLTGLTAYQGIVEELEAKRGETVLILGGSGGFGQMAIPVAKSLGLRVFATGNGRAEERMISLGVDRYFDYKRHDYWKEVSDVDYVIDALGDAERAFSVLRKGGRLLSLKSGPNRAFAERNGMSGFKKAIFSLAGRKLDSIAKKQGKEYRFMFVRADGNQLREVTRIVEDAGIVPMVDSRVFSLSQANDALRLVAQGRIDGKVVINM